MRLMSVCRSSVLNAVVLAASLSVVHTVAAQSLNEDVQPETATGEEETAPEVVSESESDASQTDEWWSEGSGDPFAELNEDSAGGLLLDPIDAVLSEEDAFRIGGSAQVVTQEQLEQQRYHDPQQVLQQVGGVYVRTEDGYGLRPNIGLRGATSDRSRKVTLMEDGVLFGPAPYSAPAAYYFPMMNRMTAVEVFKGPSAILFGPNTIGGAINLRTRAIPESSQGEIDAAFGTDLFARLHAWYGTRNEWGGILVEGIHLSTDGFKDLDGGGNTGFNRQEFMIRGGLNTLPGARIAQQVELKLGYSREHSDETYLGLSDADFSEMPFRRYRASALDEMDWQRFQVQLSHRMDLTDSTLIRTTLYRHDLNRLWSRLDSFANGPAIADVLLDPESGRNRLYYDVLTGASDAASSAENLLITNNDRSFVSQGIQSELETGFYAGETEHQLRTGIRLHYDRIDRDHTLDPYAMTEGELVRTDIARTTSTRNRGETTAFAAHLLYEFFWRDLTVAPGVRAEFIRTNFDDELSGVRIEDSQNAVLPGVGLHYGITDTVGLLAGVHEGFSPVSPGQSPEILPERSLNYEFGGRYADTGLGSVVELIGFYNAYSNLTGECSFSSGCSTNELDQQFNAGEATVYGVESTIGFQPLLPHGYSLPIRGSWTTTWAEFDTSFVSENPQYGEVEAGYRLPYIPRNQGSLTVGVAHHRWSLNLTGTYVSRMLEQASAIDAEDALLTDGFFMLDALVDVRIVDKLHVYVRGENLTLAQPLASRLPFGARPGKPFQAQVGIHWAF
jgi:Fe(3+) dicitrate transport protein